MTVLALVRRANLAAERVHHELQSIADTENGHAQLEDARVRGRGIFVVDRPRRSREHDTHWGVALDFIEGSRARQHDGENVLFADAACDELRILRAKVEDDDGL